MGRAENVIIRHISDQISRRLSSDHLIKKPTICLNSKARERDTRPYGVMLSHNRLATLVVANVSRLTRSVAFLSKLVAADVEIRFVDLPAIEGATGRFMLHQMASVAELEAGMISDRTRKALAAAKARQARSAKAADHAGSLAPHPIPPRPRRPPVAPSARRCIDRRKVADACRWRCVDCLNRCSREGQARGLISATAERRVITHSSSYPLALP
jgi:hypothetical protein